MTKNTSTQSLLFLEMIIYFCWLSNLGSLENIFYTIAFNKMQSSRKSLSLKAMSFLEVALLHHVIMDNYCCLSMDLMVSSYLSFLITIDESIFPVYKQTSTGQNILDCSKGVTGKFIAVPRKALLLYHELVSRRGRKAITHRLAYTGQGNLFVFHRCYFLWKAHGNIYGLQTTKV